MPDADTDLTRQLARLTRQIARERTARMEAEQLLEQKSLQLYAMNQRLLALNADLEQRVKVRTRDLERERQRAVMLAERDQLTGLPNRARFQAHLDAVIDRCFSGSGEAALLMIDVDRFKQINDSLGHGAGDAMLIEVGKRLQSVCREGDLVARLGGDEFAVVVSPCTDAVTVGGGLAGRIGNVLQAQPFIVENFRIDATCSVGVAAIPVHGSVRADVMRYADLALYAAKQAGRGRFAVFAKNMLSDFEKRHALEQDFREAVANEHVAVWFQPIVEVSTGRIVAAEALARWSHPTRGMIPPDLFIRIAEERGLICDLGLQVLTAACRQASPLLRSGRLRRISVNVSPLQLQDPAIVERFSEVLQSFAMLPSQLVLEVTESMMLNDHLTVRSSLQAFRARGVGLALDDFGAGYSNLSYITQLQADILKIDRGFVADLGTALATGAMIRSVTALAHELGIIVAVEGIETTRQLELIASYGCDLAQGYLFNKPQRPEDFVASLEANLQLTAAAAV